MSHCWSISVDGKWLTVRESWLIIDCKQECCWIVHQSQQRIWWQVEGPIHNWWSFPQNWNEPWELPLVSPLLGRPSAVFAFDSGSPVPEMIAVSEPFYAHPWSASLRASHLPQKRLVKRWSANISPWRRAFRGGLTWNQEMQFALMHGVCFKQPCNTK